MKRTIVPASEPDPCHAIRDPVAVERLRPVTVTITPERHAIAIAAQRPPVIIEVETDDGDDDEERAMVAYSVELV